MGESFESFYALPSLFILPFLLLFIGMVLSWGMGRVELKIYPLKSWIKYLILLLLILVNLGSTMGMKLLVALSDLSLVSPSKAEKLPKSPLYPSREVNLNIVLLIGESMKYNALVESKLKEQPFFYKKIYSGAINTDVAVPLLLNAKTSPLKLTKTNETNLFRLAKKNHFSTSFVSLQTQNSLYYIKPYLQLEQIDFYKSHTKEERKPRFDFLLLDILKEINFSRNNFIVMQQVGQHSPYRFFEGDVSSDPKENYTKSIEYSFELYAKIYKQLVDIQKPFVFIYCSDHGEFTGEGGRWGHNSFDATIYEVPMFITANIPLPQAYRAITSHHHISEFITYLLGYKEHLNLSKEQNIINGTMLSGEDGFRVML
jgi:glucan phosphoethanolaminetransferase (alkaline phosphatase superfamily)